MFIKNLENQLKTGATQFTENGALGHTSTGHALLDMNFRVTSYRNLSDEKIFSDFMDAFNEDSMLALRWLFYARDVRGGLGERRLFRVILSKMAGRDPALVAKVLKLVAVFGRWDDLLSVMDTELKMYVLALIADQINEDIANAKNGKSISLLAKWMPSINGSNDERRKIAYEIARVFGLSPKAYRKTISALRKYLDLVEIKMSAREWAGIDYAKVPSRANLIYNKAFFAHDTTRREAFITRVENGEEQIHSATNFPHDIVVKYTANDLRSDDRTLEVLWKALPNYGSGMESTLVVADGSGSMTSLIANTKISALDVANAIAIYFAERCTGEFKNTYITFSGRPQLVKLGEGSLRSKILTARNHNEVANTNIEATFDLILTTALKNKMAQKDLPSTVLIISDMEFDSAAGSYNYISGRYSRADKTLFASIAEKFAIAGYKMPKLAFWNVMSRTMTIPVVENDNGVALVSGFSPAAIKMVLSGKLNPYDALVDILKSERYDVVERAVTEE